MSYFPSGPQTANQLGRYGGTSMPNIPVQSMQTMPNMGGMNPNPVPMGAAPNNRTNMTKMMGLGPVPPNMQPTNMVNRGQVQMGMPPPPQQQGPPQQRPTPGQMPPNMQPPNMPPNMRTSGSYAPPNSAEMMLNRSGGAAGNQGLRSNSFDSDGLDVPLGPTPGYNMSQQKPIQQPEMPLSYANLVAKQQAQQQAQTQQQAQQAQQQAQAQQAQQQAQAQQQQQQQSQLHQQHHDQEFAFGDDHFPALPGSNNGSSQSIRASSDELSSRQQYQQQQMMQQAAAAAQQQQQQQQQQQSQMSLNQSTGSIMKNAPNATSSNGTTTGNNNTNSSSNGAGSSIQSTNQQTRIPQKPSLSSDNFGLMGLLTVIRMTDPDLNTLALGTDLTTLGLNLNSPENLYSTFGSPYVDVPSKREPDFYIPACYLQPPLAPPKDKMRLFSDETLFLIFYSNSKDVLQMAAAAELHKRDWKYHKELKIWFKDSNKPNFYTYFDVNLWEKRTDTFVVNASVVESSMMT